MIKHQSQGMQLEALLYLMARPCESVNHGMQLVSVCYQRGEARRLDMQLIRAFWISPCGADVRSVG